MSFNNEENLEPIAESTPGAAEERVTFIAPTQAAPAAPAQTEYIETVQPLVEEPLYTGPTGGAARAAAAAPAAIHQGRGFFGKLFDTGFHDYITPEIVKVVFVIAIVAAVFQYLAIIISGFSAGIFGRGSIGAGIAAIFLGWIIPLLWLIAVRLGLEAIVALIRTAKEARRIRHILENRR